MDAQKPEQQEPWRPWEPCAENVHAALLRALMADTMRYGIQARTWDHDLPECVVECPDGFQHGVQAVICNQHLSLPTEYP